MGKYRLVGDLAGVGKDGDMIEIGDDGVMLDRSGRKIAAELQPGDVHEATEIPTFLQGYSNKRMRADEASRPIPFDKTVGEYRTVDPRDAYEAAAVKVGISAWLPELTTRSDKTPFQLGFRGACIFVNDVTQKEAEGTSALNPRMQSSKRLVKVLEIDREIDVWTLLTTTANWNANNVRNITAGLEWNTPSGDPVADLDALNDASDEEITDYWLTRKSASALVNNEVIRDRMVQYYGYNGVGRTLDMIAQSNKDNVAADFTIPGYSGVFHIVSAKQHDATANARVSILGDDVVATVESTASPTSGEDGNTSITFRYSGMGGTGWVVRSERLERRGVFGGEMLLISQGDVPLLTMPTLGGVIKNTLA